MIKQTNIAVLCNNRMAIPAIQTLYSQGLLNFIGIPEGNVDLLDFCNAFARPTNIPFEILTKETFALELEKMISETSNDYIFTMTFPWKMPSALLNKYDSKFFNFHYGLLPEMRGADPVFETIRQQRKETGITVHSIEKEIDKGSILLKKVIPLDLYTTHGLLCTQLSHLGAKILPEVLTLLQKNIKGTLQDEASANYFKRPGILEVCINWESQDAQQIQALTRACNPWNKGAYTQWNGWNIRIVEATIVDEVTQEQLIPGSILSSDDSTLRVQCQSNTQLKIDFIYTDEGFMSGQRLFNFGIKEGERFTNILN